MIWKFEVKNIKNLHITYYIHKDGKAKSIHLGKKCSKNIDKDYKLCYTQIAKHLTDLGEKDYDIL